jgi:hypothetical protein
MLKNKPRIFFSILTQINLYLSFPFWIMKLGTGVFITRLCSNVEESLPFYEAIGYKRFNTTSGKNLQYIFSDGRMNLFLKQSKKSQTELVYFNPKVQDLLDELSKGNIKYETFKKVGNQPFRIRISDPDGLDIIIQEKEFDSKYAINPRGDSLIEFGNFGEFALNTKDYEAKKNFWQKCGFEPLFEDKNPHPWGIFSDGLVVLGIHQSQEFIEPSLTYFKVNMQDAINVLQKKGIKFFETETAKFKEGNGVTKSPDGQQFFFFEGDIK